MRKFALDFTRPKRFLCQSACHTQQQQHTRALAAHSRWHTICSAKPNIASAVRLTFRRLTDALFRSDFFVECHCCCCHYCGFYCNCCYWVDHSAQRIVAMLLLFYSRLYWISLDLRAALIDTSRDWYLSCCSASSNDDFPINRLFPSKFLTYLRNN